MSFREKLEIQIKTVHALIEDIKNGELGFPEIQRGYVWSKTQARDLIESLYKKYPSGSILLWKPSEPPKHVRTMAANRSSRPSFLVLDGQQRLTSLIKALDPNDLDINIYFNVKTEEFQLYSNKLKGNPLWVSVKEVVNKGATIVWIKLYKELAKAGANVNESIIDKYLKRLNDLEKIKEYSYPIFVLKTDDYEEATESFIRINFKGTRLREAEMAMALLALNWPGALMDKFRQALDEYSDHGYNFEPRFLMRCFVAIATGQSRFKHIKNYFKEHGPKEFEAVWRMTRDGLDKTLNLLKNNAGIESTKWIPSLNVLVPMVAYLAGKNRISSEEERSLLFWFFIATIYGRYTGSPESKLDQDLEAIENDSNPVLSWILSLRKDFRSLGVTKDMLIGKYTRSPFMPLIFSVVRKRGAKDWFTGTLLSSTNVGRYGLELHHIFPKKILKGRYSDEEINDVANIAFLSERANRAILDSPPEKYLETIEESRLKAQLIPLDKNLWKLDNYRKFLEKRRRMLVEAINQYLQELAPQELKQDFISTSKLSLEGACLECS